MHLGRCSPLHSTNVAWPDTRHGAWPWPTAQPDAKLLLLVRKIDGDSTNPLAVLIGHHDGEIVWKVAPQPLGESLCYPFRGGVIGQFLATFVGHGLRVYEMEVVTLG